MTLRNPSPPPDFKVGDEVPDRPLVFLDTETTGLDPDRHEVWQAAYAREDGPVLSGILHHSITRADPIALALNGYLDAVDEDPMPLTTAAMVEFERELYRALDGATVVAANPAFDTAMLRARWGTTPWHYRTIDLQAYAMPIMGDRRPQSLITIAAELATEHGADIPMPTHSAGDDVACLRACYLALTAMAAETYPSVREPAS